MAIAEPAIADLWGNEADLLRRLALSTLFPGFDGLTMPRWVGRLAGQGLGGVVLFGRNIDPARGDHGVAELTAQLRDAGLLVAIDEEGGDVTRLDAGHGSTTPGNAALGVVDDEALTEQVGAELGCRLRSCGIDVNLAPVADVESDARNPVVGVRSFGSDANLVARHVAAFVRGQQREGVAATAKHFPGHGGTSEDSHVSVPTIDAPIETIRDVDLQPFRTAIKSDVKLVMTAHVRVPAIDGRVPATLSHKVVTGLLREELGYEGVVMSDGLDMAAISETVTHRPAAVLALLAGVDALCVGGTTTSAGQVEAMAETIVDAVLAGRLPVTRLAEAATRVHALQHWCRQLAPVHPPSMDASRTAAHRAVTSHGDVVLGAPPLVIELQEPPSLAAGEVPWGIGTPLTARLPGTVVVQVNADRPDVASALDAHPERRVVIGVRGVRRNAWQARVVSAVRARRADAIVVDHDVVAPLEVLGEHHVLAHGAARVSAEAVADLLAGATPHGR